MLDKDGKIKFTTLEDGIKKVRKVNEQPGFIVPEPLIPFNFL